MIRAAAVCALAACACGIVWLGLHIAAQATP